jgi:anthranilate synthase/phosphoribosyltransferase
MIDNFDSFTYNIVQYLEMLGQKVTTIRNNKLTLKEIEKMRPTHIVISPGPGTPAEAGISIEVVKHFAGKIPILGVCLGHQAIIEAFGGKVLRAEHIVHGKTEPIEHDGRGIFRNIKQGFLATRYHSLAGDTKTLPECLEITATSLKDGELMGVRHKQYQIEGVQFHPESIGTEEGLKIIGNFIKYKRELPQKLVSLNKAAQGENLNYEESFQIMDEITSGELTDGQLGSFLGALSVKGVTAEELSAFAGVLRQKTGITKTIRNLLDTCGTGGDGKHTFNISTAAALVCASLGVKVAKHGNRGITSKSGSFDFLEALQIKTDGKFAENLETLKKNNFAFFFAPLYHPAMKSVAKVRQEIKIRTIFNLIGPLANPLRADFQLAGVYEQKLLDLYAETFKRLKLKRALVVHAMDGTDEISISTKTLVRELKPNGTISSYELNPADFKLKGFSAKDLIGGSAADNAQLFSEVIQNKLTTKRHKAVAAAIALNTAAGLYLAGAARSLKEGFKLAQKQLASDKVFSYLQKVKKV